MANVSIGLTALEQLPKRPAEPDLEPLAVGAHPLARQEHEGVANVDEGAHSTNDALLRRHFVDPGRRQPGSGVVDGGLRQLVEQGLPAGEVAVHRGPRHASRGGDVVHARLLALQGEGPGRSIEDRVSDTLLQRLSGGWCGHHRLGASLRSRLTRRECLI